MIAIPPHSFGEEPLRFSPYVITYSSAENTGNSRDNEKDTVTIFADSLRSSPTPHVSPSTTMYYSLAFPGWGQFDNGKKKKAAFFFIAEMVCIGGYFYMRHEINSGKYEDWQNKNLRTDRNTYLLYWMLSKFFGIIDAYVDAQFFRYNVNDITPEGLKKE